MVAEKTAIRASVATMTISSSRFFLPRRDRGSRI
jgi:hypothetical protein